MFQRKKIWFIALTCLAVTSVGCHLKKQGTVLASFDSTTITKEEFATKLQSLPREIQSIAYRRKKDFIEEMVDERFLLKEAENRKIESLPDVKDLLRAAHDKIIVAKLIDIEVDRKVKFDAEEALKYYEAHKNEFMSPLLLRASQILLASEADAVSVKAQLDAGADFDAMAKAHSTDPAAVRGGDIGYFQKGQLIPEFEEQAFKLNKGQISPIFNSQFGYHIIKLTDRVEPALKDFKVIKPKLEKQMFNQKRSGVLKTFVEKIKGNSKVQIDEKVLESVTTPTPVK